MFGKYIEEKTQFRDNEWIAARGRLTSMEEFVRKWRTFFGTSLCNSEIEVESLRVRSTSHAINRSSHVPNSDLSSIRSFYCTNSLIRWVFLSNFHISQEVERYKKCMAVFPYIRGEGWDHHHWAKLFKLLQIPLWVWSVYHTSHSPAVRSNHFFIFLYFMFFYVLQV